MNHDDIAVIVPALDEQDAIGPAVRALAPHGRVVVVDNGSVDDTARRAREAGATVVAAPRRGYGTAIQAGLRHLACDPPAIVVICDADLSDDPALLPRLVAPLARDEADLVLGDRTLLAEPGALTPAQRVGNALARRLIARATGVAYRDLGPMRGMRFTTWLALDLGDPTWGWNVEIQVKAAARGLRVLEIPVPYRRRHAGRSKISGTILGSLRAGYRILTAVSRYTPR